jgi:hypothetical protein
MRYELAQPDTPTVAASTSRKQATHAAKPLHNQAREPLHGQVRERRALSVPNGGPCMAVPIAGAASGLPVAASGTFPELDPPDNPCAVVGEGHIGREAELHLG